MAQNDMLKTMLVFVTIAWAITVVLGFVAVYKLKDVAEQREQFEACILYSEDYHQCAEIIIDFDDE